MDYFNDALEFMLDCEAFKYADVLKSTLTIQHATIRLSYVFYRWVQFVLHVLVLLGAVRQMQKTHAQTSNAALLLYMTTWVLIANVAHSLLGALAVTKGYMHYAKGGSLKTEGNSHIFSVPRMFLWYCYMMHNIAMNFSIFMLFGYWEFMGTLPKGVTRENRAEFAWYGASALVMFIDFFIVKFSYPMKTGIYALGILIAYIFATWLHFHIGSADPHKHYHYIYPGLDWSKQRTSAIHVFWSVFLLEVICFELWWISQLKRYVREKIHDALHSQPRESSPVSVPSSQPTQPSTPQPPAESLPPQTATQEPISDKQNMEVQEPLVERSKKKKK